MCQDFNSRFGNRQIVTLRDLAACVSHLIAENVGGGVHLCKACPVSVAQVVEFEVDSQLGLDGLGVILHGVDRLYLPNEEREQAFAPPRYVFERVGKKQILPLFPDGIFIEEEGKLCLEAEYALAESPSAWRTPDRDGRVWEHLSAETNGGTGLSMMVEEPDLYWEKNGPALHFRGTFTGGKYYVWLLMRFDDPSNDACMVGIDGTMQPRAEQYGRGGFFTYSSQFLWVWTLLSEVEIAAGEHVFSLAAVKSGLRIDRIYLTKGRELPPDDAHFLPSPRHAK